MVATPIGLFRAVVTNPVFSLDLCYQFGNVHFADLFHMKHRGTIFTMPRHHPFERTRSERLIDDIKEIAIVSGIVTAGLAFVIVVSGFMLVTHP